MHQGLERYTRDPGFDQNSLRNSGNVIGIRDLIAEKLGMRDNCEKGAGKREQIPLNRHQFQWHTLTITQTELLVLVDEHKFVAVFVINGVSQDKCLTHYNRVCAWCWISVYTMCRCYDPVISDQGSATNMPSTHTKRNLPRPGMRAGVLAIHHSREGWTHATPYSELKVKNLNFKKSRDIYNTGQYLLFNRDYRPPCNFPNTRYAGVYHKGWL